MSLVAQASLELAILQYHTLKCWDYRDAQSCLGNPAISNPGGFSIAWPSMVHLRSGTQPHPNTVWPQKCEDPVISVARDDFFGFYWAEALIWVASVLRSRLLVTLLPCPRVSQLRGIEEMKDDTKLRPVAWNKDEMSPSRLAVCYKRMGNQMENKEM